jgi:tetratricopeptide (TPR) repeat protein
VRCDDGRMDTRGRESSLREAARLQEDGRQEEAREVLLALAGRFPEDSRIAYEVASASDALGREQEAVPYYERALAGEGLSADDRRGAYLGLGSTYRVLGRYAQAVETLHAGVAEFPDDGALRTFLAMALFNLDEHHEAMQLLLRLVAATSQDPYVQQYRRAITQYSEDLNATE